MMERIRDSRRASCSSDSSSSNNGLLRSRRQPRFQTNEEDDELGISAEEEVVPEVRDRRAWRKGKERERLRKLLNTGKKKRRRLATKSFKTSCSGNNIVTVEACKKTEGGGEDAAQSQGITLKLKRSFGSYSDHITSSSVPRKSRSVGIRRKAQIWKSTEFHSSQPPTEVLQQGTTSSLIQKDDIEAEIAEVLYGLKSQPCLSSSEDVETESDAEDYPLPPRRGTLKLGNKNSLFKERVKLNLNNKGKQFLPPQVAMAEAVSEKKKEMVVEIADDSNGNQSDSVKKESETAEIPTSQKIKKENTEKFMIDLMAPPPLDSCTEDENGFEAKINPQGIVMSDKMEGKREPDDVSSDVALDHQRYQQRDWFSRNFIVPKAQLSTSSSMPPWLIGRRTVHQSTSSQKLVDSTSQPKRCTTHHRIARSIHIHQQAMRGKSMGVYSGTDSSVGPHNLPKFENVLCRNLAPACSLAGDVISVKEESRDSEMYQHKYHPSFAATGCSFISSQNQSQVRAASQNEISMMPASASIMRFSYLNNGTAPIWEILPTKSKSNEVCRGQSQPPPLVFSPVHNIQLSGAPSYRHQNTSHRKRDSISTQLVGSENRQPSEQQQQQNLPPFLSDSSGTRRCLDFSANQNPSGTRCLDFSANQYPRYYQHHLALSKPRAYTTPTTTSQLASIGGGALVVDFPARSPYSLSSFTTTQSRVSHPTMKTFQVPASVKDQQPASSPANNYRRDLSILPESIFEKIGAPQAGNFPLKLASDVLPSQPHNLTNSTSESVQQISLGRNGPALQTHPLNSSSNYTKYDNGSLTSQSRSTTPTSRLTNNNSSDSSRCSGKGESLMSIGQIESTLNGYSSSLLVCGSKVPTIVGIHPNRPQELKY